MHITIKELRIVEDWTNLFQDWQVKTPKWWVRNVKQCQAGRLGRSDVLMSASSSCGSCRWRSWHCSPWSGPARRRSLCPCQPWPRTLSRLLGRWTTRLPSIKLSYTLVFRMIKKRKRRNLILERKSEMVFHTDSGNSSSFIWNSPSDFHFVLCVDMNYLIYQSQGSDTEHVNFTDLAHLDSDVERIKICCTNVA